MRRCKDEVKSNRQLDAGGYVPKSDHGELAATSAAAYSPLDDG